MLVPDGMTCNRIGRMPRVQDDWRHSAQNGHLGTIWLSSDNGRGLQDNAMDPEHVHSRKLPSSPL